MATPTHLYRYVRGTSESSVPQPELATFPIVRETDKGYWLEVKTWPYPANNLKWVSKTGNKRFAYPTKELALSNFIIRTEKCISHLYCQNYNAELFLQAAKELRADASFQMAIA